MGRGRRWRHQVWWLTVVYNLIHFHSYFEHQDGKTEATVFGQDLPSVPGVNLFIQDHQVVMQNGVVNVTLSTPEGLVTKISYNGVDNLLEPQNQENNGGYWNIVWGKEESLDFLEGTSYKVVMQNENQVEISFIRKWDISLRGRKVPLNIDKRFVMLRDSPGLYTYTVLERLMGWPDLDIKEARIVFKLRHNKFHYMAISDNKQRMMPMPVDRQTGQELDYPEAVLLTNPINPHFKREVDDKYFYSGQNKDNRVYGWVCSDPPVGFWMITPSDEFRTGGPFKQDLTTHVGPSVLNMFVSTHYAGEDLAMKFRNGEPWKKVFGPVFVYLNSDLEAKANPSLLWKDAKQQMLKEVEKWPYTFPYSNDFVQSNQRGNLSGQILVLDRFTNENTLPGSSAYVGLALPGAVGSWQRETKGYQFWTKADSNGNFVINGVIAGIYSLYAWVPGIIGDYKYDPHVIISPGSDADLGSLVYEPPRNGPTLWEIGVADRKAAEFYVPKPEPSFKVHKYYKTNSFERNIIIDRFRQYGLWRRYKDLYPNTDLTYTIGFSNYTRDWFFAQVTRCMGNNHTCKATTWQIIFELKSLNTSATNYTLRLALASANDAELQVRFNDRNASPPHFTTGLIGKDNAVARHGTHGLYRLYSFDIAGHLLLKGRNTIFLKQARDSDPFREIMYDYIRFEAPPPDPDGRH